MTDANSNHSPTAESRLARQLSRLIDSIQASGRAILPSSNNELLQSIVEAAARIFGAAAASMALLDEKTGTLEFKVAVGRGNAEVIGMRIPMNKGIAGYVAMTGQPIAVSNVQQDPRFAQDFAKSTGYVPHSILATPLLYNERVIGVMEVLDKVSAAAFGIQDMELMGLFAQQAALAIDQSQRFEKLGEAFLLGLKRLAAAEPPDEVEELVSALEQIDPNSLQASELLKLAEAFNQASKLGSSEMRLCLQILKAFLEFGGSQKEQLPELWR